MTQITLISQMCADYLFADLTERIIASAYKVHNGLGGGFLESVYVRALQLELKLDGIDAEVEVPIQVCYRGEVVGDFRADILVAGDVVVEVKAVANLTPIHEAQLVNYLNATGKAVGLLLNFSTSVQVKRKIQSKNLRQSAKSA